MKPKSLVTSQVRSTRPGLEELLSDPKFLALDYEKQKQQLNILLQSGQTDLKQIIEILLRNQRKDETKNHANGSSSSVLTVYIIGAGPVGLLTAIKLIDAYKTQVKVVIFDKRSVYTRERVLFITKRILREVIPKHLLTKTRLAKYGCGLENFPMEDMGSCQVADNLADIDRLAISTRILEDDLKELLTSKDYEYYNQASFVYNEDSSAEYMENYVRENPCHVLVGADAGAISTKMFNSSAIKNPYQELDTWGLVVQFIPEVGDSPSNPGKIKYYQHRYRAFRQQQRDYKKCNSQKDLDNDTCVNEPPSYYIAVQLSKPERDYILENEMGGQEWLESYILGDSSSNGKYLDRLLYDASGIYNFNLKPGRVMNQVSMFKLGVSSIDSQNYSRVVTIEDTKGNPRSIWFPLIGDSVLSVNFFSGAGLNAGFAMVEFIGKALAHLLPFDNVDDVFADKIRDPYDLPGGYQNYSPMVYADRPKAADMFPDILPLTRQYTQEELKVFNDPERLQTLVDVYKKGIDEDLRAGSIMADEVKGLDRLLGVNSFTSYLDYMTMIEQCNSNPEMLNKLKQSMIDAGANLELIDLDDVDGLYTKFNDRLCLMSHNPVTFDRIEAEEQRARDRAMNSVG